MNNSNSQKFIIWVLKIGLIIVPFLPLLVTRSLYFPFISGKNFAFRILIEVLLVFWVWLLLTDRSYLPKKSIIFWSVTAAIVALTLSTIFSIWPHKAFWSSFERMEGLWAFFHYFVYFLMIGSVFKKSKDWLTFFSVSLGVSVVMSLYGVAQLLGKLEIHQGGVRLDGTMGNATYFAIYLVFHIFIFAYFLFKTNKRWLKYSFLAAIILELFIVYHTATRGAILGLIAGLIMFAAINALWAKGRVRKMAITLLLISVLIPIVFIAIKDTDFIYQSDVLGRFSSISLEEKTTQSRFIIWGMAINTWKERPILGYGPESFVYLFSKEYDARLWRQEPWFDRAHNVLFDWLSSAGIVGLLAYLSIFLAVLVTIRRLFKVGKADILSVGIIAGLLTAYFVHNLFVFDNFTSYFLFFSVLAYLHWLYKDQQDSYNNDSQSRVISKISQKSILLRPAVVGVLSVVVITSIYLYNIRPIKAGASIINALSATAQTQDGLRVRDLNVSRETLVSGIALNTFGTTEIREQLAQYADRVFRDQTVSVEDKVNILNLAVSELEKQVEKFPFDIRAKIFLSTLNSFAGNDQRAIDVLGEAIEISPQRQQFHFLLGEFYFRAGEERLALDTMKRAYELDPENPQAVHNYAVMAIYNNQQSFAENLLQEHFSQTIFPESKYINAYAAVGEFNKLALVWEKLVEQDPNNLEYRLGLASSYVRIFMDLEAIEQLRAAILINPAFKDQGELFIGQIRNGTIIR